MYIIKDDSIYNIEGFFNIEFLKGIVGSISSDNLLSPIHDIKNGSRYFHELCNIYSNTKYEKESGLLKVKNLKNQLSILFKYMNNVYIGSNFLNFTKSEIEKSISSRMVESLYLKIDKIIELSKLDQDKTLLDKYKNIFLEARDNMKFIDSNKIDIDKIFNHEKIGVPKNKFIK